MWNFTRNIWYMKICANYMINFLIASSLFTNFLEILLSQENRFQTLCVHYLGAPTIFYSVLGAVCVCVACVADRWG